MTSVLCVGLAVHDTVLSVATLPGADGTASAGKIRALAVASIGGGCAATAAVTVARLGADAHLITRLGDDSVADVITAELESYGVGMAASRRFAGRKSPLSAVLVDQDGERLVVNYRDPALPEAIDWLPTTLPDGIDAVLADTRWPAGAAHMFGLARAHGVPAILDGESPVPDDDALLGAASHVAFSEQGLRELTGCDDPAAGLRAVAGRTGAWLAVTLGSDGVVCRAADGRSSTVAAYAVDVVDTLGAGDVWHGAFALALAEGRDESAAVDFASAAAALKCMSFGGRAGVPERGAVERLRATGSG